MSRLNSNTGCFYRIQTDLIFLDFFYLVTAGMLTTLGLVVFVVSKERLKAKSSIGYCFGGLWYGGGLILSVDIVARRKWDLT